MKIKSNNYSNIAGILFFIILLFDLGASSVHYFNLPIDGDLIKITAPAQEYQAVLNDPIGISATVNNIHYAGAGRFSSHYTTKLWFDNIPPLLQWFGISNVSSVYLSSSLFVFLLQLGFIIWAIKYITKKELNESTSILLVASLTAVLIQFNSYYHSIGIIDKSITYAFFYALPLLLLLLYFFPLYNFECNTYSSNSKISLVKQSFMLLLAVYLSFSGPLIQPIVFISYLLYIIGTYLPIKKYRLKRNKLLLLHFSFLFLMCLYAFYVSKFNNEADLSIPLLKRYELMSQGILKLFSGKIAWVLIIVGIILNSLLLKRAKANSGLKKILLYISLFSFCYILMLPLGGYRSYRPFIIRYDTLLPITLLAVYLLLFTTYNCFKHMVRKELYLGVTLVFILIFLNADLNFKNNEGDCQKKSLSQIATYKNSKITIVPNCNLLSWDNRDLKNKQVKDALVNSLKKWNIMQQQQTLIIE